MNDIETLHTEQSKGSSSARWKSFLTGAVGFPLAHGAIPWALARLGTRRGWSEGRPSWWNLLGLVLSAAGGAYAVWGMVLHSMEGWQWTRYQTYLLRNGPYRFSRNPMYVGELALWLGWAIFYGSVSVLLGWLLWWAGFAFYIVPAEESALETQFGESFRQYKNTVPRWFGRARS